MISHLSQPQSMNKKLYSEVEKEGNIIKTFQYGSYADLLPMQ